MSEFAQWLNDMKDDNTSAGCKMCCKKIMEKLVLSDHAKGFEHLYELKRF